MFAFITILNLITLPIFYIYVFVKQKDNFHQYRYKISIFVLCTVVFNIFLCYLFYIDLINDRFGIISSFLWIPNIAFFGLIQTISLKHSKNVKSFMMFVVVIKILNIILFVPMIVIYLLHNSSTESIYRWSILIPISLLVLFSFYPVMLRQHFNKGIIVINKFSSLVLIVAIIAPIILSIGNNDFLREYPDSEEYSEILTNKSISQIANIETNIKDGTIRDFVYQDNYLYLVTIVNNYGEQDTIYLTIYSIENNEVVYQHESIESGNNNRWLIYEDKFLLEHNNHLYFLSASGLYLIEDTELTMLSSASIYDSYFFKDEDNYFIARDESDEELNAYLILEDSIVFQENLLNNGFTGSPREYNDYLLYINKDENKITLSTGIVFDLPVLNKDFKVHTVTEEYVIIEEYLINIPTKDYFYKINSYNEIDKINFNNKDFLTEYSVYNDFIYPSTYMYSPSTKSLTLYDSNLQSVDKYILRNEQYDYNKEGIIYLVRFFDDKLYFASAVAEGDNLYIELSTFDDIIPTIDYKYFDYISINTIVLSIFTVLLPISAFKIKNKNNDETEN